MTQEFSIRDCVLGLRKHTGAVFAGVLAAEDVIYVKVIKADLIATLQSLPDYPEGRSPFSLEVTETDLYVHCSH